jgi:hypothetical protein
VKQETLIVVAVVVLLLWMRQQEQQAEWDRAVVAGRPTNTFGFVF